MFGKIRPLIIGKFSSILLLLFLLPLLASSSFSADSTSFDPTKVAVTAKSSSGVPVGTIISWPVAQNPADFQNADGTFNWLECDGQSISATIYPELSAVVGPTVPDLRGLFLRGYGSQTYSQNNGSTVGVTSTQHVSGQLGHVQGDAGRKIYGNFLASTGDPWNGGAIYEAWMSQRDNHSGGDWRQSYFGFDSSRVAPTADENRPVNTAVRYLIRALR